MYDDTGDGVYATVGGIVVVAIFEVGCRLLLGWSFVERVGDLVSLVGGLLGG